MLKKKKNQSNYVISFQCQLAISFAFISLCVFHPSTKRFLGTHPELLWVALAILFVTLIAMACCTNVRRTAPMNFIFLGLFTCAQSFMLGMMTIRLPADTVSTLSTVNCNSYTHLIKLFLISNRLGYDCRWHHRRRLSWSHTICIPN